MAIISKPNTFSAGAVIIAAQHNSNFDTIYADYNGNIDNTNIVAAAGIVDTKLATITTANKVNVSAITGTLATSHGGTGSTANANAANGVVVLDGSSKLPAVDGSQLTGIGMPNGYQEYTTGSGNFTAPDGVTTVYVTMIGGGGTGGNGGNGASATGGGGGSSGGHILGVPYTVVPSNTYAYAVGAAGADTTFGTGTVLTAKAGGTGGNGSNAGTAAGIGGYLIGRGLSSQGQPSLISALSDGGAGGSSIFGAGGAGGTTSGNGSSPSAGSYGAGGGGGGGKNGGVATGAAGLGGYILIKW